NVVAAQMRIAVGGEHLINVAFAGGDQLENGNVERAAAEIVDRHFAALLFVETVSQCRGGRLVNKPQYFETRDFACILRGLALRVIEIGRHGDDGAIDGFAEMRFSPILELAQDERGNFRRREKLVAELDANNVLAGYVDAEGKQPQFVLDI